MPYTGELACMVLVWFPFCTFSSLSLSLSKHPYTSLLNADTLNIRYPVYKN